MRLTIWMLCVCGVLSPATGYCRADQSAAATPGNEAVIAGDYFAAGASGEANAPIEGDAFIAGGAVIVRSPVQGDAVLLGGSVHVANRIGSDLYAAGGKVVVDAAIGHNARLSGGRVRVTPQADIAGKATLAGSTVRMEGRIGGALVVFGDSVIVDGEVDGGAAVVARELEIGPNARIDGPLTYRTARKPDISAQALISGGTRQSRWEFPGARLESFARVAIWTGVALLSSGLFLAGTLIVLLLPAGSASVGRQLRSRPLASLLIGFALTVLIPVVAIVAMMTLIGIPLGAVLLFVWPAIVALGYLFGVIFCGDALAALFSAGGARRAGRALRVLGLAIAMLALAMLWQLVWIGPLVILLLLFIGTGALALQMRAVLR